MGDSDDFLFDPNILDGWDESLSSLVKTSNLTLRPLKKNDYELGYLDLLAQLTAVGELEYETYESEP